MLKKFIIISSFILLMFGVALGDSVPIELFIEDTLMYPDNKIDLALVKLTIDKEIDNTIDIDYYMAELDKMADLVKKMLPKNPTSMERLDTLKKYLYEPGEWNDYKIYSYDLDNPEGTILANKLLPNYLKTRKGDCVSMPILFLLLGKKIGLNVALALAPAHCFIRYTDAESGKVLNIETTNGGSINRDVWYIEECNIPEVSVKNKVYLQDLTSKETVVVMVGALEHHYTDEKKYSKVLALCNLSLLHCPQFITAITAKGNIYSHILDAELEKRGYTRENINEKITAKDEKDLNLIYRSHIYWFHLAERLGWRQETPEQKEKYLKGVEAEKEYQKQLLKNKQYSSLYRMPYTARFIGRDKVTLEDDPANYFGANPYVFVNNNPMRYTDPDGRIIFVGDDTDRFLNRYGIKTDSVMRYEKSIKYIGQSEAGRNLVNRLENSEQAFYIKFNDKNDLSYNSKIQTINYDPNSGLKTNLNRGIQSPALGLAHEMGHAVQHLDNNLSNRSVYSIENENLRKVETPIAIDLKEPVRLNYDDHLGTVSVADPTYSIIAPLKD
ncbi:MAG: hypothetical protein LBJ25_01110 [Candidatus Margulisbacteria bacterium]|jgi:RHS repeat-associated protein|nr:hypothetical protein [Candidatus Margulisiibacteriota bacterium]